MRRWIYFCRAYIKKYTEKLHLFYLGIGRKTVDADTLACICRAATPSLAFHAEKKDMDHNTALGITSFFLKGERLYSMPGTVDYSINIQEALNLVKEYGLEDNVKIECAGRHNKDGTRTLEKVDVIRIENLFVRGYFSAEFNDLESMELSNNVFMDTARIRVIGVPGYLEAGFRNNHFKNGAEFEVFNVHQVIFHQNKITDGQWNGAQGLRPCDGELGGGLKIKFAPPLLRSSDNKEKDPWRWINEYISSSSPSFIEMAMEFNGNVMSNLFIEDECRQCAVGKEPFGKIDFRGKNRISSLKMHTRHNVVNLEGSSDEDMRNTRADVDRVFFDTSDKIGVIPEDLGLMFTEKHSEGNPIKRMRAMYDRQSYASYGKFFTDLQNQSAKKYNRVLENIYARKARSYSRAFMSSREDKFIFWWGDIVSNGGTSWAKPLLWFLSVQTIFAIIAWFVPFVEVTCSSFAILWWEFLDPLSGLPSIKSSGWVANCLSLLHKLTAALMLYESIKAMRRFS